MWMERAGVEFRVELGAEEKWMNGLWQFGDFHQTTVRRSAGENHSRFFYFYNIWKTTYSGTTSGYEHGYCHRHLDVAGKLASQGWYIVSSTAIHEDIGNEINYVLEKRK